MQTQQSAATVASKQQASQAAVSARSLWWAILQKLLLCDDMEGVAAQLMTSYQPDLSPPRKTIFISGHTARSFLDSLIVPLQLSIFDRPRP
jgi:hypothetical protein